MNKSKYVYICIILTILVFLSNIGSAYSATSSELNQQKDNIQSQINEVDKELKALEAEMGTVEKQVSQLNTQIAKCQGEIDSLNVRISQNEVKLKQAEEDYIKQKKALNNRIVAQYEEGETSYLDYLLGSESLTDFISKYYIIGEIAELDNALLNNIENTKKEIEQTKQQLEQDKINMEAQYNSLQAKKSERQVYVNQLTIDKKDLQAAREEYDAQLEQVKKDIQKLAQSNKNSSYIGSGIMAWPTPGYYTVTSPYGYRIHPIYKDYRLHNGVDLAAPGGANFVAAESGTVILAKRYGGYGNCVIIDHGGGITTLYGHGTSILASVGQYVTKGTPILTVGSTGVSTGNHAHFEVRINGSTVDPLPYIK